MKIKQTQDYQFGSVSLNDSPSQWERTGGNDR